MVTAPQMRPLISRRQLSEWLNMSPRTLCQWHRRGYGPAVYRCGRVIRYRPEDVEQFLAAIGRCELTKLPAEKQPTELPGAVEQERILAQIRAGEMGELTQMDQDAVDRRTALTDLLGLAANVDEDAVIADAWRSAFGKGATKGTKTLGVDGGRRGGDD